MSRIAKQPLPIPKGVELSLDGNTVKVKGKNGELNRQFPPSVKVSVENDIAMVDAVEGHDEAAAMRGTARVLLGNMVHGVSTGFQRKLILKGVGYRAKVKGKQLELTVGYSHPVLFDIPETIKIECPSQTEIVASSADNQLLGEICAKIRRVRPPERYKGKGIRYENEHVALKEVKKK